jgi:Domain of unknown function (DUF4062)
MANMRIFVSSTAYDLGSLRSSLRQFIQQMGFEPVLSDYSDVLYDPREHTHLSCLAEVRNCDMLVLIVGARFGGRVVPEVLLEVAGQEYERLLAGNEGHNLSVTQAEVLTALSSNIPTFAFVDSSVMHDYRVYQLNRGADIKYPSIEQEGTAPFIFNFIDFLQSGSYNNAVQSFLRLEDIHDHLRKQWTSLFQRLLREHRDDRDEDRRIDRLTEQFDDLKTALLSTVGDKDSRTIARAAVKYRRLIDLLQSLSGASERREVVIQFDGGFEALLNEIAGITEIQGYETESGSRRCVLLLKGGGAVLSSVQLAIWRRRASEWDSFKTEGENVRRVVLDELMASNQHSVPQNRMLSAEQLEEFLRSSKRVDLQGRVEVTPEEAESNLAQDASLAALRKRLIGDN